MDAKEISRIVKACRKYGVRRIKIGDLELEFLTEDQLAELPEPRQTSRDHRAPLSKVEAISEEGKDSDAQNMRDDEAQNLLIEDPERYEDMVANGEFEEDELQSQ